MKFTGKASASSSILKGLGKLAIGTGKVALAVLELSQAGQRAHEKREKARLAKYSSTPSHSSFDDFIERNGDRPLSECRNELRNQMEQVRQDSYQEGGEALRKGVLREVE
ncbi:hypothetical protein [Phytopseudomonas seleniipraecipitans]|uniref:Uncharacterized protein n=1 Tax=Phytopseudomonas seleniipraecipitans TaxID=640205 RepID=A0A1G7NPZ4_9GAMM|nr:hypothetical protein [Pseudomonas seleniipraecipitans]SDF75360.1 hypothetical protein SAMN05216381_2356 [Pseudomonas seleniipraecipitans]